MHALVVTKMNLVKINGVPLLGSRSQTVSLRYKVTIASFQFKGFPRFLFLAFGRDRNLCMHRTQTEEH